MYRLTRTREAEQDLISIWKYIASDNPNAADTLIRYLDARSRQLIDYPHLGPARDDVAQGMRYVVVDNYLVLYRIEEKTIEIVRYLHGAKNILSNKST